MQQQQQQTTLRIDRIASIAVKNVTSKSGLTQPVHFVCKNAAFELVLSAFAERSSLDLTHATLELSLVYDARAPPYKLVDFVAGKKVLSYQAAGVSKHGASLQVRIGVLSSQVEGALFRVQVDAVLDNGVRHTVLSPPLTVVSKPYLALRAEGQRGKPKPQNKRRYDEVTKNTSIVAAAAATDASEPAEQQQVDGGELLGSLDQMRLEQQKQRRLLEQLLRNQQTQLQLTSTPAPSQPTTRPRPTRRAAVDSDDDEDEYEEDEDSEEQEELHAVKRSRRTSAVEDDETSSSAVASDAASAPRATSVTTCAVDTEVLSVEKQLENAAEEVARHFDGFAAAHSEHEAVALLRRVLPSHLLAALGARPTTHTSANVCELFLNGCSHERELNELRKQELFGGLDLGVNFQ